MSLRRAFNLQANSVKIKGLVLLFLIVLFLLILAGCDDMKDQPKYEPLEENPSFPDRRSARPLPTGVVPISAEGVEESADYPARDENGELVDRHRTCGNT